MNFQLKKDKYTLNRGGYSEVFSLKCGKCDTFICFYQKDGPGPLLRTYVDRMINPVNIPSFGVDKKLICPHCQKMLGLGIIYEKENRPAYALFQNMVKKEPTNKTRHLFCCIKGLFKN